MSTKVYLDYLMPRESFRFREQRKADGGASATAGRENLRLRDLADDWFERLRKPDFQPETNAWTPEACRDLLQSLVRRDVIPGVILWKPEDSALVYVIDGAHRLSVIRAWMIDDWGERRIDYFNAGHRGEITAGANEARALVGESLGSYADFKEAHGSFLKLSKDGKAPRHVMSSLEFERAIFYSALTENISIETQWVEGNYAKAEMSFLQINRSGERLSSFEQSLIQFRNGPYARVVSSIVSAGKAGHFWPEEGLDAEAARISRKFPDLASAIHNILFLPPHDGEVRNLNLPLVISKPGDRYEDCLELVALIADNILLSDDEAKEQILAKSARSEARDIISIGSKIFRIVLDRLSQLVGESINPKSIAIVPLVYTYNHQGVYSKNLLYGLLYWLFSGGDEDVRTKKIALSANRGRFESILSMCKSDITAIASRKGGGFKSTKDIAETIAQIVEGLTRRGDQDDKQAIESVIADLSLKPVQPHVTLGRTASRKQRSQINISSLLAHAPICEICKGYINLESGKQYDHHFERFAEIRRTSTDKMRPVHPFCNNMREQIENVKGQASHLLIPKLPIAPQDVMSDSRQLLLDL